MSEIALSTVDAPRVIERRPRWAQRSDYIKKTFARKYQTLTQWNAKGYAFSNALEDIATSVCEHAAKISCFSTSEMEAMPDVPTVPFIVNNGISTWPAFENWTTQSLNDRMGQSYFRLDDNHTGRIRLEQFLDYMKLSEDDAPLYIFDSQFAVGADQDRMLLKNEYGPLSWFSSKVENDMFSIVLDKYRPPWRWVLIGGPRSGTNIHQDPLGTSAWNAVITGEKLWVFFPPNTPAELRSPLGTTPSDASAMAWFAEIWPRVLEELERERHDSTLKPFCTVQKRGDVVFVPQGWFHVVINLTASIAVTHNFAMCRDSEQVIPLTVENEPKFAEKWMKRVLDLPSLKNSIESKLVSCESNDGAASIEGILSNLPDGKSADDHEDSEEDNDDDWSGSDESNVAFSDDDGEV